MKIKHVILFSLLSTLLFLTGCKKSNKIDCTIYWQLYMQSKNISIEQIEKAYSETFFGYYERLNDNSVIARNTTQNEVRSLTLKLASMADKKIMDIQDPQQELGVEVRVYINYANSFIEEIWSKNY